MATTKLYLDTRAVKRGEAAPLKLSITKHGVASYISLNVRIFPSQWDKVHGRVIENQNRAAINSYIQNQKQKIDNLLLKLTAEGELANLTSAQIRNKILDILDPKVEEQLLFLNRFKSFVSLRKKQRTKELYEETIKRILQFDPKAGQHSFEQINKDWLTRFDKFLSVSEPSQNSRSIHFRNIRAVFNDAIDNEVTTYYPFRKFMIRPIPTVKRAYSVERLRELFSYPCLPHEQKYIDLFKLLFFLIGINIIDLYNATKIQNGRIVYLRAKTSRLYDIKVEKEALEIIERYRGKEKLIGMAENFKNAHTFTSSFNRALKQIGTREHITKNGKRQLVYHSAFPDLSAYVARHSWASIAYDIGISKETISDALGHSSGNQTTEIYIKKDQRRIDEANRKVIDYVLGL